MSDTDAELTFDDDLDWLGNDSPWHALDGTNFGTYEPLVTALPRLLLDGESVEFDRDGNRVLPIRLECTGDDVLALNEAEAALRIRLNKKRSTLRWKPPGMNTPVSVFDTFTAVQFDQEFDDLDEMNSRRVYRLSLPALPHARSENEETATLTLGRRLVDDCSSAADWLATATDDTVTAVGGKLKFHVAVGSLSGGIYTYTAQPAYQGTVWLDVARYVSIVVDDVPGAASMTVKAAATGFALTTAAATASAGTGRTRHYFGPVPGGSVDDLVFEIKANFTPSDAPGGVADIYVDDFYVDSLPAGTSRVAYGQVEIEGSVRSPQNVTIENAALGNVQVFVTQPYSGFRPDVSPYYASSVGGSWTADTSLISGGYWDGGEHTYDIPAVTLRGVAYQVVAHVSGGIAGDGYLHTLTTQLVAADGTTELTDEVTSVKRTVAKSSDWGFVTLGTVYPPAEVSPESTNIFRLTIDAGLALDEAWLIPMDADLLQVEAGDATRLRVVAPSADYPIGAVFVGSSDVDERSAVGKSLGRLSHFEAGVNLIHVVTTGAVLDPADVVVSGYPHWSHNAAK